MLITDLPEEILIIIIRKLDVKSQLRLYNTCKLIRNIICMPGVLKHCSLSFNTLATANTLRSNFFKNIAYNLLELNICGVVDLCKTKLLPALKKLKRLKVLDVSYTELTISDLIAIHESCPTIKDIAINFVWKFKTPEVPSSILLPCQKIFENFENVKFVGPIENLVYSKLPFYVLEKARLRQLKFVVVSVEASRRRDVDSLIFPEFNHFALDVLDREAQNDLSDFWSNGYILKMLLLKECEYIVMLAYGFELRIYASPSFVNYFKDVFNYNIECTALSEINFYVPSTFCNYSGVMIKVWNKATTTFDEKFYNDLSKNIKQYVPHKFKFQQVHEVPVANKFSLFYITPTPYYLQKDEVYEYSLGIKRPRVAMPNFVLNYDRLFKEEQKMELVVHFKHRLCNGVALKDSCMYLQKLTYLNLIDFGKYSSDFFKVLFECCVNLVTLNVQSPSSTPSALAISRSIALSKTLKNLRISEKYIDFPALISSLGQCTTLENIHICERLDTPVNAEYNNIGNVSLLVEVLHQLYNIYIEAPLSQSAIKKTVQLFNKTKKKCNKHHIHFDLNSTYEKKYIYYPLVSVFRLSVIN